MSYNFRDLWYKYKEYGEHLKINFVPIEFGSKKLIFMKMGRSAGKSIMDTLHQFHINNYNLKKKWNLGQGGNDKWLKETTDKKIHEEYFIFINVRNPFSRVVSFFEVTKHYYPKYDFNLFIKEHFLDSKGNVKKIPNNGHLWPSSIHYEFENGQQFVDFVIKVENLTEDWKNFCSRVEIPYTNLKKTKLIDYRPYFTPEQVEIVSEFYKRDLELFNYKF